MMKDFFHLKINPWGLILAMGAVAGAITVGSFLSVWWWGFELASNYQWQCAVLLTGIGLFCLAKKKIGPGVLFVALAAVNWVEVYPLYAAHAPIAFRATAPPTRLRCVLINVQSSRVKAALVLAFIRTTHPDVIVLNEVDEAWDKIGQDLAAEYPNSISVPRDDTYGVALLTRLPLDGARPMYLGQEWVPSIYAQIRCGDKRVMVLGTHLLPPGGRDDHLSRIDQMSTLATSFTDPEHRVILLGDLNIAPWSPYFKEFAKKGRLVDSSKGFGVQGTWPVNGFPMRIPIDHCLVSSCFKVVSRSLGPSVGSDHFPLIVDLEVGE